jgi:hypothetical protein
VLSRKPLPRKRVAHDLTSLARTLTPNALNVLAAIMRTSDNHSARVAAAIHILDRGWGKAPQAHTGADGEGAIQVTIRHLIEGMADERRVIDVSPVELERSTDGPQN